MYPFYGDLLVSLGIFRCENVAICSTSNTPRNVIACINGDEAILTLELCFTLDPAWDNWSHNIWILFVHILSLLLLFQSLFLLLFLLSCFLFIQCILIPRLRLLFWRRALFGLRLFRDVLLLLRRLLILVVLEMLLLMLLLFLLVLCHHLLVHFLVLMHIHRWSSSLTLLGCKILCLFWGHVAVKVVWMLRVIWIGVWFLLLVLLLCIDVVIDGGVHHHHLVILVLLKSLRVWHHMSWWRSTGSHHSRMRMHPVRRHTWHAGRSHTMRRHVHSLRVHVRTIGILLIHGGSCLLLRTLLWHILRSILDQFGFLILTFILRVNHRGCPKIGGSPL